MDRHASTRAPRAWSARGDGGVPRAVVVTAAALLAATGCTGPWGASPEGPADDPPASPTASGAPTPEPAPEPAPTPSTAPSAPPAAPPVLRIGGAVGDHPVGAPESQVVGHLSDVFGAAPRVEGDGVACETSGLPGRRLVWDGLTVLVRTTDESDAATEPFVAGWRLDEQNGTSPLGPLRTAEGVGLGDDEQAVMAAYPQGRRYEVPEMGMSLWVVGSSDGDDTDDLAVRLVDGVVTAVTGGFGCGE